MNLPDLERLVREDKNALANKEGLKPLFLFAEEIKQGTVKHSSEDLVNALIKINLLSLSPEEVQTFLSFVHYSQLENEKLLKYLYSYVENKKEINEDSIFIYALLLRFVVEMDNTFLSLKQVLEEKEIRDKFPWIWVDSMSYLSWEYCSDEIGRLLYENEVGFKNLLLRIPYFQKRFGKEKLIEAFKKWHPNLRINDRRKLDKWAKDFNIRFGLSISAERLIERAAFLQNQIFVE